MEELLKELSEFKGILDTNVTCDWDENAPGEEFSTLANQLQTLIDKHTPTEKSKIFDALGEMISDNSDKFDNYDEILDALVAQHKINGEVSADDIVCMWEPLEWSHTVDSLLKEIGYFYSSLYTK